MITNDVFVIRETKDSMFIIVKDRYFRKDKLFGDNPRRIDPPHTLTGVVLTEEEWTEDIKVFINNVLSTWNND